MTVDDLKIGEEVYFGAKPEQFERNNLSCELRWTKVDYDNTMLSTMPIGALRMDGRDPECSEPLRKTFGCSFFPLTELAQWLNAKGEKNWFTPAQEFDKAPEENNEPGFLSGFFPWELGCIVPHEVSVAVPEPYREKYGEIFIKEYLVSIPAAIEILGEGKSWASCDEGRVFPFFQYGPLYQNHPYSNEKSQLYINRMMTRTAKSEHIAVRDTNGSTWLTRPETCYPVVVKIKLDPNTIVSDSADADGRYTVLNSKGNLSCVEAEEISSILSL